MSTRLGTTARVHLFLVLSCFAGVTAGMLKVLTPLLAIRLGATPLQIGLISGLESAAMAVMTLPAGILIGRYGAWRVYLAGSIGITTLYLAAAAIRSVPVLTVVVGVGGFCMALRVVSVSSAFLDQLRLFGEDKAGWYRGAGTVGSLLLGPAMATAILEALGVGPGYITVGLLFGAMGVCGPLVLPRAKPGANRLTLGASFGRIAETLRQPGVGTVCLIELSSGIALALFASFILLTGVKLLGLTEPAAVSVRFFEGVVSVAVLFLCGRPLARRGATSLYRLSLVLTVTGLVAVGLANSYASLVIAALLLGIGLGVTSIVNVRRLSESAAEKGTAAALQTLSSMSGAFAGSLLGGVLSEAVGLRPMFVAGAVLYALLSLPPCFGRIVSEDSVEVAESG